VTFGNAALDPERTLHIEIGLQQQLSDQMGLELTLFSKDIRNLTGVEIRRDVETTAFFIRYINRDVGTSRGLTLSLFQRPIGGISWDLDYTLQFADGTSSNPNEAFGRFESGQEEILSLTRLDWDRRHVLTNSITVSPAQALSVTLINRYQTGSPYTSERQFTVSYIKNNLDRPSSFTSDLRFYWRPPLVNNLSVTAQVDNLFDAMIHYGVYSDTGRGDESVAKELYRRSGAQVGGINSLDEYYYNQGWFSAPRRVTFGLRYDF
jgi:outer membrane receptor protein involved in Fe transport